VYIPKVSSRHQALNFDKSKITEKPLGPEKDSGLIQPKKNSGLIKPTKNSGVLSHKNSEVDLLNSVRKNSGKNSSKNSGKESRTNSGKNSGTNSGNGSRKASFARKKEDPKFKKGETVKIPDNYKIFLNNECINDNKDLPKIRTSISFNIPKEDEDFSTKRDDLLHKKNLDCITECFKKKREMNFDLFGIDKMLFDLNWEDI
jgi:hypothetical protein